MSDRAPDNAAGRSGLIVIERTAIDPPGSYGILYRLGLLSEPVEELPKTKKELEAAAKTVAVLNDIRRDLGLGTVDLDTSQIHVQGECDFAQQWGTGRQAFTVHGHVYIPRLILFHYFLQHLTHELVHLSAFRAVIDPARGPADALRYMRSGFSPVVNRGRIKRHSFGGFSEAATELIASEIRSRLVADTGLVEPRLAAALVHGFSCPMQVSLLRGLIRLIGAEIGSEDARRLLFTDYFNRTTCFLRRLARTDRQAVTLLARTDTGADALLVAQRLGLKEVEADINRLRLLRPKR